MNRTSAPGDSQARGDVFISYSHSDADWVRGQLLPRLEGPPASLKVIIDDLDFAIGKASDVNMEEAIKATRHTLAIMTPDWVKSEWSQYELLVARQYDPAGEKGRIVPLMLKKCSPPKRITFLSYADFTDPARFDQAMENLLRCLCKAAPVEEVFPAASDKVAEYAFSGLGALLVLMRSTPVRDALVAYRTTFEQANSRIEKVCSYKDLHDRLHDLQVHCYTQIELERRRLERQADDQVAWESLSEF